ncbi:aldose epimerase family protein [Flexithrix dorotheae]|uniref:aldose epimerase family protein n=1 Tax=Flexithrix dorotheae TaxID=70993 RepID=UPI0003826F69|nr:aldose epimerase family protein [Flexithrix dorotheae]
MQLQKEAFGKHPNGENINLYTLKNDNGLSVSITNYGGIVVSLFVPDKNGTAEDITLGFDKLDQYIENNDPYMGAIIGRFGNRIANGKFQINGIDYNFPKNNGKNTLHGGLKGFDKVIWEVEELDSRNDYTGIKLSYLSKDMEEGFPGNLKVEVVYSLNNENEFKIEYFAETDKNTHCNLTNHAYFNLKGAGNGNILDHKITIKADNFTPVNENMIPLGTLQRVSSTPFDFREPMKIGERIEEDHQQLKLGTGYDHNFVIKNSGEEISLAAEVEEPISGRLMEVYTSEPGIQFYTGNFLGGIKGKKHKIYEDRFGFCLETQHFPDSPNQPSFPSTLLEPGEKYESTTIYKFSLTEN